MFYPDYTGQVLKGNNFLLHSDTRNQETSMNSSIAIWAALQMYSSIVQHLIHVQLQSLPLFVFRSVQIDNQLSDAYFPIVLHPYHIPAYRYVAKKSNPKPCVELTIARRQVPECNLDTFKSVFCVFFRLFWHERQRCFANHNCLSCSWLLIKMK